MTDDEFAAEQITMDLVDTGVAIYRQCLHSVSGNRVAARVRMMEYLMNVGNTSEKDACMIVALTQRVHDVENR
jgi:hypothetical protein